MGVSHMQRVNRPEKNRVANPGAFDWSYWHGPAAGEAGLINRTWALYSLHVSNVITPLPLSSKLLV